MLPIIFWDGFTVPVIPWDKGIDQRIASHEVMIRETQPKISEMTIEQMVEHYARKNGADVTLSLNIARCESGFNPSARNPRSSAKGVFQFLDRTWKSNSSFYGRKGASVLDAESNIDVATKKIAREGTWAWVTHEYKHKPCRRK